MSDGGLTIVGEASCIDNEVGFLVEMQDTFTAANGDQVTTAITMQLCPIAPGIYHGVGTYVVTGGTGRFASATGSGVFDGTGNFNTGTIICALTGTISINHH
jgi:phage-related minor tail protein